MQKLNCLIFISALISGIWGNFLPKAQHQENRNGTISTVWKFVIFESFCLQDKSSLDIRFSFPHDKTENITLILIPDRGHEWNRTQIESHFLYPGENNHTCEDQVSFAGPNAAFKQSTTIHTDCFVNATSLKSECNLIRKFASNGTRLWYLGVADCSKTEGLEFTYSLQLGWDQIYTTNHPKCRIELPHVRGGHWDFEDNVFPVSRTSQQYTQSVFMIILSFIASTFCF